LDPQIFADKFRWISLEERLYQIFEGGFHFSRAASAGVLKADSISVAFSNSGG
jgi:hypothetical protein